MTALILLKDFLETQIEIWRPVVDFDGYEVSNLGHVRSWRTVRGLLRGRGSQYARRETPRLLAQNPKDTGRLVVNLRRDRKLVTKQVHHLVARAFIPNPENLPQINHLTGIYTDNRQRNLEWATYGSDLEHAVKFGLTAHGVKNGWSKLNPDKVREIRKRYQAGESQRSLARAFSVSQVAIGAVCRRETWSRVE